MDRLSPEELRLVPTEKLVEHINRLLAELHSRGRSNQETAVQVNGLPAVANESNGQPTQNGHLKRAALEDRLREAALSNREREVLSLMGEGLKTTAIAERLQLSVHTIETYREKIKKKLRLKNAAELWHFAVRWAVGN